MDKVGLGGNYWKEMRAEGFMNNKPKYFHIAGAVKSTPSAGGFPFGGLHWEESRDGLIYQGHPKAHICSD